MNFALYSRGGVWYVRIRQGGADVRRSTGTGNKRLAEKIAEEWVSQSPAASQILRDFLAPYYTENCPHVLRVKSEGKSYAEKTRTANRAVLEARILPDPICNLALCDLRRADILDFRDRLVQSIGACRTVNIALRALSVALHEALFREVIDRDPCAKVGLVKYQEKARRALSIKELKAILEPRRWNSMTHWRATVCAAMTGLRAGEVRGLRWGSLDAAGHRLHVVQAVDQTTGEAKAPKWGKRRVAAYPQELQVILEPLREEPEVYVFREGSAAMGYKRWAAEFARVALAAKVPGVTLHSLRHTLNTLLRGAGVADDPLRGAFGWSDAKVQDGYTHREAYDLLPISRAVDDIFGGKHGKRKGPKRLPSPRV